MGNGLGKPCISTMVLMLTLAWGCGRSHVTTPATGDASADTGLEGGTMTAGADAATGPRPDGGGGDASTNPHDAGTGTDGGAGTTDGSVMCTCHMPHTRPTCVAGRCHCVTGYADCDADLNNGCETSLRTSENCGGCGMTCGPFDHATPTCATGRCEIERCEAGFADCDGVAMNGCEVDTRRDPMHCGGCGRACTGVVNAVAICRDGTCRFSVCHHDYGNCDRDPANGCETSLTTLKNCGGCGWFCDFPGVTPDVCADGRCPVCNHPQCPPPCQPGFADCDGNPANGCETWLTTLENCGACAVRCSPLDHATPSCATGTCEIERCEAGFADCDGSASNGCEYTLVADGGTCP